MEDLLACYRPGGIPRLIASFTCPKMVRSVFQEGVHMNSETYGGDGLQPGSKAPAFEMEDHRGGTVSLQDMQGKPFVLFFYPKDNTSG